jgi:RNAse (barnase) inhibitor barstar
MLDREEYIEQSYLFRSMLDRMTMSESTQELLKALRDEILSTTKLPLAIDFMSSEMRLTGTMHTAMAKLPHYFTPFQTYLVAEAEREAGKFDFRTALEILRREADYRAAGTTPQGMFLFQFECLCRNRLGYDRGLDAIAGDPIFDADWRSWIDAVRRQVGLVDFADLIYVRSELCARQQAQQQQIGDEAAAEGTESVGPASTGDDAKPPPAKAVLFGEKEGRIALANRRKDPLYLFAALQRQLGYPAVPRPLPPSESPNLIPTLQRQIQRLETRLKLLEEEHKVNSCFGSRS